jgi:hypothetical protein
LQKPFRVEQLDEALRHASDVSCASKSSI